MARLPLVGGSYSPRSVIANCQRCINLYPEHNAVGPPVPVTHYQRPGLKPLFRGVNAVVRCLYQASNGKGYAVIDHTVYAINPNWTLRSLGTITTAKTNPASMTDNGVNIFIVDGSQNGWGIRMSDDTFYPLNDPTGLFKGADRVDVIDTFIISNNVGIAPNNEVISTLSATGKDGDGLPVSGGIKYNDQAGNASTMFGFKAAYPDPVQTLIVNNHQVIIFGTLKSEIWFNGGLPGFPFLMYQGAYIEHGAAKYSIACTDISVFFLGQDLQGDGVVWRVGGDNAYRCRRISNHALEFQIRKMKNESQISDAIGYCYQQDGDFYYVLHFPAGDQTWVYDDTLGAQDPNIAWHQEGWTDPQTGILHRHRANCHAFIYGKNVVGDFENGTIYEMSLDTYTDTVSGIVCPITFLRTFPHIGTGETDLGPFGKRPIPADGRRIQFTAFMLDLECGMASGPATIALRYSDDRGRTYSSDVLQTGGQLGQYLTQP